MYGNTARRSPRVLASSCPPKSLSDRELPICSVKCTLHRPKFLHFPSCIPNRGQICPVSPDVREGVIFGTGCRGISEVRVHASESKMGQHPLCRVSILKNLAATFQQFLPLCSRTLPVSGVFVCACQLPMRYSERVLCLRSQQIFHSSSVIAFR